MALFGKKTEDKQDEAKETKAVEAVKSTKPTTNQSALGVDKDLSWVLSAPRMSEKAIYSADKGVYVFNVSPRANKQLIKEALDVIYKVKPVKINVSKIARKKVRNARTGIAGVKAGGKKAYVYLKKGDKINLV